MWLPVEGRRGFQILRTAASGCELSGVGAGN